MIFSHREVFYWLLNINNSAMDEQEWLDGPEHQSDAGEE
jgi:hypothetical protein